MPALLTAYDKQGKVIGCCDSKCYDAKNPRCTCICGGTNHGCGLRQAINNVNRFDFDSEIEKNELHPVLFDV